MTDPEKIEKYVDWLIAEIGFQSSYHNHKETMAWVATAFYVSGIIVLGYKAPEVSGFWPEHFSPYFCSQAY